MDTLSFQNGESYNVNGNTATAANSSGQTALNNLGVSSFSNYVPPTPNSPVNTSQINNGSSLNLPPTTPTDNGSSLVAGSIASASSPSTSTPSQTPNLDSQTASTIANDPNAQNDGTIDPRLDPDYVNAEKTLSDSTDQYKTELDQAPSEANLLTTAQGNTGALTALGDLNNARTSFATEVANYNQLLNDTQNQNTNNGVGEAFQGNVAQLQRDQAVKAASQATILNALQGNYTAAESLAEKTANLQYNDAQKKLDNLKSFITLNQNNLNAKEKTAVAKIAAQAKIQQAAITQAKTDMKNALTAGVRTPFFKYANSDQVYNAQGQKVNYQQYIEQGGDPSFKNVSTVGKTATTKTGMKVLNQPTGNQPATPKFKIGSTQDISQAQNWVDTLLQEGNSSLGLPTMGEDGKANPATYNKARATWAQSGRPVSKFDSLFKKYISTNNPNDYQGAG